MGLGMRKVARQGCLGSGLSPLGTSTGKYPVELKMKTWPFNFFFFLGLINCQYYGGKLNYFCG